MGVERRDLTALRLQLRLSTQQRRAEAFVAVNIAALPATLVESEQPASVTCNIFTAIPQLLKNVRFGPGSPLEAAPVKATISAAEKRLGKAGRLLIRKSGTERLIRVMAEGEDESLIAAIVDEVCAAIAAASPPAKSQAAE